MVRQISRVPESLKERKRVWGRHFVRKVRSKATYSCRLLLAAPLRTAAVGRQLSLSLMALLSRKSLILLCFLLTHSDVDLDSSRKDHAAASSTLHAEGYVIFVPFVVAIIESSEIDIT